MPGALLSTDQNLDGAWITIGSFDGVHLGHQALISKLIEKARKNRSPAVVITFYPHPMVVLKGVNSPFYLTSPEEKTQLLTRLGVDKVITLKFDRDLASRTSRSFLEELKQTLNFTSLWVGPDFALGRGKEGTIPVLQALSKEMSFQLHIVSPITNLQTKISSSEIRNAVQKGDVLVASSMLGRWYSLQGVVVPGDGRGKSLGIPTANLQIWPQKLLPKIGVYTSRAWYKDSYWPAVVNIGLRPTFSAPGGKIGVEAHLLDFSDDLYGQHVRLDLISWIRGEQKFSTVQALVEQIKQDILKSREVLQNVPINANLSSGSTLAGS